MSDSYKERRRHPRYRAENVAAHLLANDQQTRCEIVDISSGGMFLKTDHVLPVGIPIAVTLTQPGHTRVLRLTGRVIWALAPRTAERKGLAPGMRLRFDPLNAEMATDLANLLRDLGGKESDRSKNTSEVKSSAIYAVTPSGVMPSLSHNEAAGSNVAPETPKLIIQVQGLLMQMGELQQQLADRDRTIEELKIHLTAKEAEIDRLGKECKAAELAIQRLSMRIAARR